LTKPTRTLIVSTSAMENHREFTEWAVARGVEINGIAAHRFPGRGLGIIAEKDFKAGVSFFNFACV
jgi:hypothetical protein